MNLAWEFITLHSRMINFHFNVLRLIAYCQMQLPIYFRKLDDITKTVMSAELDEKEFVSDINFINQTY